MGLPSQIVSLIDQGQVKSALTDVLPVAFIFLVISLLFFWHLDYPRWSSHGSPSSVLL
jgi:hypothetical protein